MKQDAVTNLFPVTNSPNLRLGLYCPDFNYKSFKLSIKFRLKLFFVRGIQKKTGLLQICLPILQILEEAPLNLDFLNLFYVPNLISYPEGRTMIEGV
jgi:hypothetical protein